MARQKFTEKARETAELILEEFKNGDITDKIIKLHTTPPGDIPCTRWS